MNKLIWSFLLLFLFISSCSFINKDTVIQEDFEVLTHRSQESVGSQLLSVINDVNCSSSDDVLRFTLSNQGDSPWSVDRQADAADEEFVNLRLFFNDYLVNANVVQRHPVTSDVLFGPERFLSENCEPNRQVLHSGSSMSCMLEGLPLLEENVLRIEAIGMDDRMTFRCSR